MPSKRLLFTATRINHYGASRMVYQYGAHLARNGHNVTIVHGPVPPSSTALTEFQEANCRTILMKELASPWLGRSRKKLLEIAKEIRPHTMIGSQIRDIPVATYVARKLGVRSVAFLQNMIQFGGFPPLRPLKRHILLKSLRQHSDLIIPVSKMVEADLVSNHRVSEALCHTIQNGVDFSENDDTPDMHTRSVREELNVPDDRPLLVNVGRICEQKAQDILVQALAILKKSNFTPFPLVVIAGDATSAKEHRFKQQVVQQIEQEGLQDDVRLLGFRNDPQRLLAGSDFLLLPSRWEGFGLVLLEAFRAQCPIIVPDTFLHIQDFEGCFTFRAESPTSLAECLVNACKVESAQRRSVGARGREYAMNKFSLENGKQRFAELVTA